MSIFWISLKKSFAYRSNVIFSIIGSVISILISIALWTFVFNHDQEKISYMTSYVILANVVGYFYSGTISESIAKKVSSGEFALDLLKPKSFWGVQYQECLGSVCAGLILKSIPVLLFFFPFLTKNMHAATGMTWLLAGCSVVLGHYLYVLIFSIIGFLAFTFIEIWPFNRLANDTIRFFSGSFIPISLFPGWLKNIADALPFKFLYSFPLEMLLGEMSIKHASMNLLYLMLWLFILGGILFVVYRGALRKCTVQGG